MTDDAKSESKIMSLLTRLPDASQDEVIEVLLRHGSTRLERITSEGQASPDGFWYDQDQDEWVAVLAGSARLLIEGEETETTLAIGDCLFIAAHTRHRVTWTDPDQPTVWLALFTGPGASARTID